MKVRASCHINNRDADLALFQGLQENIEHLYLKLAASLLFFDQEAVVVTAATHPALQGQEFYPDLLVADYSGEVKLWVECGTTTLHKLTKVTRRFRDTRIIVLAPLPLQAKQQVTEIALVGLPVEVWTFPPGGFAEWCAAAGEDNDIVGEATETSLNLVLNGQSIVIDLVRIEV